jgi:spermidine synthase
VYEPPEVLARADGVHGELALRRRSGDVPVYELIVNGVFLMDTAETSTERLLAEELLHRHPAPRHVLVGGLGLGFTVAALLADRRVEQVTVVEIEPVLVNWLRAGLVPVAPDVVADPRVRLMVADIRDALAGAAPESHDAILLDVDNGPDFLVHGANAAVYQVPAVGAAAAALRPGGVLAVWSAAPADSLRQVLAETVGPCAEVTADVVRDGRPLTYHLYFATRPSPNPR